MSKFSNTPTNFSSGSPKRISSSSVKKTKVNGHTVSGKIIATNSASSIKKTKVNGHTVLGKMQAGPSSSVNQKKIKGPTMLGKEQAQAYLIRRITFAHTGLGDYKKGKI